MAAPADMMSNQLMAAAQIVEQQLDAEIEAMSKMDGDDLEALRQQRMAAMKKQAAKKQAKIQKPLRLCSNP